jgi:NADPH:quinone reductase-like Zn-dependent oxidoreductase
MTTIKKVVITEFGDVSKLAIRDGEIGSPGAGEVQIAVEYTVVSGSDVNMRRGTYPLQKKAPLTPGYSVVGRVSINGAGCQRFRIGDRVACLTKYDGQLERRCGRRVSGAGEDRKRRSPRYRFARQASSAAAIGRSSFRLR